MPIGIILDSLAVLFGGLFGTMLANKVDDNLKTYLTLMFGLCVLAMGINSVILVENLPAIILSIIVGTAIGICFKLETSITKILSKFQKVAFGKITKNGAKDEKELIGELITVLVLFCASANGIYGSLDSGFSGDHTILISKAIMDFFTALIFACNFKSVISLIAIPQFIIYFAIFLLARFIYPLTNATMIADFKGCGGLLMIATGFRVMKIKAFPLVDMLPSLILVLPISAFWVDYIIPLLSF